MMLIDSLRSAAPARGALLAWWLGQGGFAFKNAAGRILFVDPYLSDSVAVIDGPEWARLFPPPISPFGAPVDLIIATHDHPDHADPQTIPALMAANPGCLLAGPGSVISLARRWGLPTERLVRLDRGATIEVSGFMVHARYAEHTADSISIVIEINGTRIAHTGDGLYSARLSAELAEAAPAALIAVINGKLGNMGPQDAARLAFEVDPGIVIPCHYGMFRQNTVDPAEFLCEMEWYGRVDRVLLAETGVPLTVAPVARLGVGVQS